MTRTAEREQFLADIITTAVEGGIGYWSWCRKYRWVDLEPRDVYAEIEDFVECDERKTYRIDIDLIEEGVTRITDQRVNVPASTCVAVAAALAENDAGEIDAELADIIVQAAIFGEVVYG